MLTLVLSLLKEVIPTLYNSIYKASEHLATEINSLERKLTTLPDGNLICCHHKSFFKWYHRTATDRIYIPKSNESLIQALSQKKYLTCLLEDYQNEKYAMDAYLKTHKDSKVNKLFQTTPELTKFLSCPTHSNSDILQEWINEPFPTNPNHPENLIHLTPNGHSTRSKSEAMIAMSLFNNNIPYRYECKLILNNICIYPDFTIMHPITYQIYYWEHFGMLDDPDYYNSFCKKINLYTASGIIPMQNLIITTETINTPLTTLNIQKTIDFFLK